MISRKVSCKRRLSLVIWAPEEITFEAVITAKVTCVSGTLTESNFVVVVLNIPIRMTWAGLHSTFGRKQKCFYLLTGV